MLIFLSQSGFLNVSHTYIKFIFLTGSEFVVRLQGLPYSATEADIKRFLDNQDIQIKFLFNSRGLPSGSCFVTFKNEEDRVKSFSKDKEYIGSRYIEGKSLLM